MKRIHSNISEGTVREVLSGDGVDLVCQRLNMLSGEEKIIMEMHYENGSSFRQIAALLGVNEYSLSRRIRNITKRLLAGQYIRCLRNRRLINPADLRIAKDYYIGGRTLKQIADKRGSSFYEIRRTIERIEAILEAAEKAEERIKYR